MTPDERLEKLTERVDALTQSVELLATMHRDHEKRLDQLSHEMNTGFALLGGTLQVIGGSLQKIAVALEALTKIAETHEVRLNRLEGGTQ